MQTRRALLSATATLLATGCLATSPGSTDSPESTPTRTSERHTDQPAGTGTPECMRGYTVRLLPFAPPEQLPRELQTPQRELFDRIVAEDGVTLRTFGQAPVRDGTHVVHDGTYYRVELDEGAREEVPARRADLS